MFRLIFHLSTRFTRLPRLLPLRFPQRPFPDPLVHPPIHPSGHLRVRPNKSQQSPLHDRMTPVRSAAPSVPQRAAPPPNLGQGRLHKIPFTRNQPRRSLDLAHGAGDEVAVHEMHTDAWVAGFEFGRQRG